MINFIFGVLFMSFCCVLSLNALDNDKSILGVFLTGPIGWIVFGTKILIDFTEKLIRNTKYKSSLVDKNNKPCYCSPSYTRFLPENEYKFNDELENKYKIEDGWNKEYCMTNTINLRYTPMKIVKKENMYKIPRKVLMEFKKNYKKENK